MGDVRHTESGPLGVGEQHRIDAIDEVLADVGRHLVADVDDEAGDDETGDGVGPGQAEGDSNQCEERAGGGERVEPGVLGVGNRGGRLDAPPASALVAGDELVAEDSDERGGYADADVAGAAVVRKFVNGDVAGEDVARPDDEGDAETGDVLGSLRP